MAPPHGRPRRAVLSAVAAGLATIAGCTGDDGTPTESPTDSPTDVHTVSPDSATPTPTGTLSLSPIGLDEADGPLTVYPSDLRDWLRTAATTDRTVRSHAETPTYDPEPPLAGVGRVHLDDASSDISGIYDLSVEGGTRYRLLVGADEADPPADADVTPVSSLPPERRDVALAAIGGGAGDDARVYPETTLGSWVRTQFFGGYFSHDGTTYRGKEAQQTDAEFFATEVWYVLSATAVDAPSAANTLRLTAVDDSVHRVIERLRSDEDRPRSVSTTVTGETRTAARGFAEANPIILTHDAIYRVSFEG